jgi:hypothetical protein
MPGEDRSFATRLPILLDATRHGHGYQGEEPGRRGEPGIHASGHYEDGVAAAAAAASAAAFFRSFSGLGRRLPNVPLKILPRLDRRSPLPIIHLRKKMRGIYQSHADQNLDGRAPESLEPARTEPRPPGVMQRPGSPSLLSFLSYLIRMKPSTDVCHFRGISSSRREGIR